MTETKKNEIWVEMWEYPNYEISNLGRVRNAKTEKLLSCKVDANGYRMVSLWKDGKVHTKRVGRYTWMSHNNCFCKATIDHINEVKSDDRLENLQCISLKENYAKRKPIPKGNKYNLTPEDKKRYATGVRDGVLNAWDIHKQSKVPLNYIKLTLKRGTWNKFIDNE